MIENRIKRERIIWLDGIKVFACLCIVMSHFCSAFIEVDKNAYSASNTSPIILGTTLIFRFFLDGEFWVRVFCIVSGYLAAMHTISNIRELFVTVIMRYLRFVLPFITLSMIIIGIEKTIGFHAVECGKMMGATWLSSHNYLPIKVTDILRMIFAFNHRLDSALWTIFPIFVGNIMVYIISFILFKLYTKSSDIKAYAFIIIFCVSILKYNIISICISCCILGAGLYWITKENRNASILNDLGILILIVLVSFLHDRSLSWLTENGMGIPRRLYLRGYGYELYGALLIIFLSNSKIIPLIMKNTEEKWGGISFAIYILHMPICDSITSLACEKLVYRMNYNIVILLIGAVNIVVVVAASYL